MASPFSFHCIICIEEFDQQERYPVVLPCGHTYVCNQCAERLTKCMECRTSLVIDSPQPPQSASSYRPSSSDWSRGRGGVPQYRPEPPPKVQIQPKKRLPLPKNVVLMSLMEATDAVHSPAQNMPPSPVGSMSPIRQGIRNDSLLDEEEEEEEKIRLGTSLAASACGTYVVTDKGGVQIYPSKPLLHGDAPIIPENEDVDAMVRFFHLDHKMAVASNDQTGESIGRLPAVALSKGDRVQIVCIEDGWAKLARGYGYLRASSGQVAKVGGSVDRACQLEALLRSITLRRKELREEQRKLDSLFITLMGDLQTSLLNDEDLTVIGADTFADVDPSSSEEVDAPEPLVQEEPDDSYPSKPHRLEGTAAPSPIVAQSSSLNCFPQSIFENLGSCGTPIPRSQRSNQQAPAEVRMIADMVGAFSFSDENSISETNNTSVRLLHQGPHPSPRAMSAGARAWRERNNRPASRGIDFRTGMSGHMALLSTQAHKKHPHDYLPTVAKMSAHTGLTMTSSSIARTKKDVSWKEYSYPLSSSTAPAESHDDEDDTRTV